MHLLNVHNRTLEDFVGSIPSYAILSHTWGKNEITYQDIRNPASVAYKAGWTKINGACSLAGEDGYDHIWIDTCCIDKTSSAEISEAINSMFNWYKDAAMCYAYLSDVSSDTVFKDTGVWGFWDSPKKRLNFTTKIGTISDQRIPMEK